jgi:hypothetical protein
VAEGELNASPMAGMNPPQIPDEPPPVLTDEELRRLLKACEGRDFTDRWDAAILRLFLDTGVRVSEAAGIMLPELLAELQWLPRDLEVLAFQAGCEDYCEREVDELELQSGRVYLHLGAQRDDPPRRQPARPMAEIDPDQEAALRRLRAAFGFVEVLEVVDHEADSDKDIDDEAVED